MAYMKHAALGNKHVKDEEVAKLEAEGWVKWPRTKEQKMARPIGFHRDSFALAAPPIAVHAPVVQPLTTDEFIQEVVAVAKRKPGRPRKG